MLFNEILMNCCLRNLYKSLRTSSLVVRDVGVRFLWLGEMTRIVLAAICFLACGFLVFVLIEWVRDAKRKAAAHPGSDHEVGGKLD
jgi:hypothetical protein